MKKYNTTKFKLGAWRRRVGSSPAALEKRE